MDFYLMANSSYSRLESEFKKYGKLIFCLDFDDTIFDYHNRGIKFDNIIDLLKRWEEYSEVIIFTGNGADKHEMMENYLNEHQIKFKGINCDSSAVSYPGRKIYANVYIDDRAGLIQVYNELSTLIDKIERGVVRYNPPKTVAPKSKVGFEYIKSLVEKIFTKEKIEEEQIKYSFDAFKIKYELETWIKNWFSNYGPGCKCVVGISGGVNSAVVAALCVRALGKDNVVGVLLPQGNQSDLDDARAVVDFLGIESYGINIANIVDRTVAGMKNAGITITEQAKINLVSRIRMSTLYSVSQTINGRVANTNNLSNIWIGNTTRFGDMAGDFAPLSNLTLSEVKALGYELKLPKEIIEKVDKEPEIPYDILDMYLATDVCEDESIEEKIDKLHDQTRFKYRDIKEYDYEEEE